MGLGSGIQGQKSTGYRIRIRNNCLLSFLTYCLLFQFLSPFCKNALAAGIQAEGGKPDDITVLLATVSL
jgi:hypothetical protein